MSDLFERVRAAYHHAETLPEVVAGRCVHTILEGASCKAYVDVCPRQAWVLDEEQLGIDVDRCNGCGLCAAACPQDAIHARLPLELKEGPDGSAREPSGPAGNAAACPRFETPSLVGVDCSLQ